ncbi:Bug family tripartite tricarboxylate transporter substrate binding protein [Devosia sp.]|uniref:Bug family tripartite tricarboxylate transporter substrate binding protein n=1 Tax=Devosia sp. TaxID=1871048 RepID=UPI002FC63202
MGISRRSFLSTGVALAAGSNIAWAQTGYPSQPVKVVVGFAAGGSTDQVGRIVADGLSARFGKPFIVDNRPGASGNLAAGQVARAPGDGHTLLLTAVGLATTAAFNPSILQAHPINDLAPIALLAYTPNVLLASTRSGFKTVTDVIAGGKKDPNSLSFGHSGYGGGLHLTGEIFSVRSGTRMTHIPYKGVAPMMQDLLAGQVNLGWDNLSTALPFIRSGRVQALAVASKQRAPELPNLPTFGELGYDNMVFGAWFGLSGPKSLPTELAQTIAGHVSAMLSDSAMQKRVTDLGLQILESKSAQDYASYVEADIARWKSVVTSANIKPLS